MILIPYKLIEKKKMLKAVIGRKQVSRASQRLISRQIEPEAPLIISRLLDQNLGFANIDNMSRLFQILQFLYKTKTFIFKLA